MKNAMQVTRLAYSLFLFTTIAIAAASCKKNGCGDDKCDLIPAKILRVDCDRVIFKLETSTPIGDVSWTNVDNGMTYSNVVIYSNTCQIAQITGGHTDVTLYVDPEQIANPEYPGNCVQCMALSKNPPQQWVNFKTISTEACASSND